MMAQFLRFNKSLVTVDFDNNALGDAAASALGKALSCNATLQTLRLPRNDISLTGATAILEGVTRNHELRDLVMEISGGTMSPGIHIPPLKGLAPADTIDLSSRNFGPMSAAIVAGLIERYRPQLVSLAIDKNGILTEGAHHFAEMLKSNDDIKTLDVRFCSLGPEGMACLSEALKVNTSVECVLALSNRLGLQGAKDFESVLHHTTTLRYVDLQDNLFPAESKAALLGAAEKVPGLTLKL